MLQKKKKKKKNKKKNNKIQILNRTEHWLGRQDINGGGGLRNYFVRGKKKNGEEDNPKESSIKNKYGGEKRKMVRQKTQSLLLGKTT